MTHFYYAFWVFKSKPNWFYHSKVTTELPPEEFIPNVDMTDILEFYIRDCTNEEEMNYSYSLYSAYRRGGFLPMRERD